VELHGRRLLLPGVPQGCGSGERRESEQGREREGLFPALRAVDDERPATLHAIDGRLVAQGSVIDLKDVQLLDAMNKEYVGLVKRVVPSVVSINTSRRENRPNLMVDQFGRDYCHPSVRITYNDCFFG